MKNPGGLSLEEWVEYWREGNRQHVEDGIQLLSTTRDDLAFASEIVGALKKEVEELRDLLASAREIARRQGEGTAWERFDNKLAAAGISAFTAKTFHILPSDLEQNEN